MLLQVANNAVKPIWSGDESMSNHYSTSVLKDGYLYGFDGRQEFGQTLRCVELATGKVMWNVDGFGAGTLLIAGDTLVITRESGELALAPASPKAFRFNARAQLIKGVVRAYPALANGRYYVRNDRQLARSISQQAKQQMQHTAIRLQHRRRWRRPLIVGPRVLAAQTRAVERRPDWPEPVRRRPRLAQAVCRRRASRSAATRACSPNRPIASSSRSAASSGCRRRCRRSSPASPARSR